MEMRDKEYILFRCFWFPSGSPDSGGLLIHLDCQLYFVMLTKNVTL